MLTWGAGGAYKRGPFGAGFGGWPLWGWLFEIVEKWEGMRGRRPEGPPGFAQDANVWRPLFGFTFGWIRDELESLILAQNERWRHA